LPAADPSSARLIATPQNPYDINEDFDDEDEDDDSTKDADQRVGEGSSDETHNKNNPNYNRKSRRRKLGKKTSPTNLAGLPRQATLNKTQASYGVPKRSAGRDTSGGK
jgi:hypothetical protein